jgi:hypothetical protein
MTVRILGSQSHDCYYQRLGRRSFVLLDTLILMVRVDTFMTFDNFVTPRGEIHAESSMTGITNRK